MKLLSKYALTLYVILVAFTIVFKYEQFVIAERYTIHARTACDTSAGRCFVAQCEEGEECDTTPYMKVDVRADIAPHCLEENDCEAFTCPAGSESICDVTYCSGDVVEEGEACLPVGYGFEQAESATNEVPTDELFESGTAPEEVETSSDEAAQF